MIKRNFDKPRYLLESSINDKTVLNTYVYMDRKNAYITVMVTTFDVSCPIDIAATRMHHPADRNNKMF